jgi:hypothetical protein
MAPQPQERTGLLEPISAMGSIFHLIQQDYITYKNMLTGPFLIDRLKLAIVE